MVTKLKKQWMMFITNILLIIPYFLYPWFLRDMKKISFFCGFPLNSLKQHFVVIKLITDSFMWTMTEWFVNIEKSVDSYLE